MSARKVSLLYGLFTLAIVLAIVLITLMAKAGVYAPRTPGLTVVVQ